MKENANYCFVCVHSSVVLNCLKDFRYFLFLWDGKGGETWFGDEIKFSLKKLSIIYLPGSSAHF
jgi:hypothetical protein